MEVRVTRKFQVTIPERVRKKLGIKVGDRLFVKVEGGRIIMEPMSTRSDPINYLKTLADKYNIVTEGDLIEEIEKSLEEETGAH